MDEYVVTAFTAKKEGHAGCCTPPTHTWMESSPRDASIAPARACSRRGRPEQCTEARRAARTAAIHQCSARARYSRNEGHWCWAESPECIWPWAEVHDKADRGVARRQAGSTFEERGRRKVARGVRKGYWKCCGSCLASSPLCASCKEASRVAQDEQEAWTATGHTRPCAACSCATTGSHEGLARAAKDAAPILEHDGDA